MKGSASQPTPMATATPREIQRQIGVRRTSHTDGSMPAVTTTLEAMASSGLVAASVMARVSTANITSTKTNAETVSPVSHGTGSGSSRGAGGSGSSSGGSTMDPSPASGAS